MIPTRPTPINDDHGDQFPGALPARAAAAPTRPAGAEKRLVRMPALYVQKADSAAQAGCEGPARELAAEPAVAESTVEHGSGAHLDPTREHRTAGRRSPGGTRGGRRPGSGASTLTRMGRLTRRSLEGLDRYTLDVFNPGPPFRTRPDRSA